MSRFDDYLNDLFHVATTLKATLTTQLSEVDVILICQCPSELGILLTDQPRRQYLYRERRCHRCRRFFRTAPHNNLLIAAFKLGGWSATRELAQNLFETTDVRVT